MSRVKRFTHSLGSGYVLLGGNVLFTLASVPLALHYLSKKEFGLWALVVQVLGYLQLIDLGMSSSIARILIDHKDAPGGGVYGAIIKTGALVLAVQGAIIAVAGAVASLWLPALFSVPAVYQREFQIVTAGQCFVTGALFAPRITSHVLQAHQRYDAWNLCQVLSLAVNFGIMWLGFILGWGLYSLLVASLGSYVFGAIGGLIMAARLKLFPPAGAWGSTSLRIFHELFSYGKEIFLLSLGWQLVNASQVIVVTSTLGLDAAAVWSIATKPFTLAQTVVNRLFDFSAAAFAEMMVLRERERLLVRFRDLMILSASLAAWAGSAVALCNPSFLVLWTKGRISWSGSSDWLMALLVVVYSTTRCIHGLIGTSKDIRALKYIYPLEGGAFLGLAFLAAPRWGMSGIIASALVTNALFSGVYGFWRVEKYFGLRGPKTLLAWLRGPLFCLVSLAAVFAVLGLVSHSWNTYLRLGVEGAAAVLIGLGLFWRVGLSPELRAETAALARNLRGRVRSLLQGQLGAPSTKV
jgi:O-antigen/teichoic acid export membrane protein